MRKARKLVLLIATALAVVATGATSALADGVAPLPNGDYEKDNWKQAHVRKTPPLETSIPGPCPNLTTGPPIAGGCLVDSGSNRAWSWNIEGYVQTTCQGGLKTRVSVNGSTFIADMTYDWGMYTYTWCYWTVPDSYATNATTGPMWYGSICRHVPTNTYWVRQPLVVKDRVQGSYGPNQRSATTWGKLTGTAILNGMTTANLVFENTSRPQSYMDSGFDSTIPPANGGNVVSHKATFPFVGVKVYRTASFTSTAPSPPLTAACGWAELT
jgi:hypothetical protein